MKMKKVLSGICVLISFTVSSVEARVIPGWDEPYDPPAYYSKTEISVPDSAPSPFALRELMRGSVYDYTRHLKSILFGERFAGIMEQLLGKRLAQELDMKCLDLERQMEILLGLEKTRKITEDIFILHDIPVEDNRFLAPESKWIKGTFDSSDQYAWLSGAYKDSVSAAQRNQEDMNERINRLNNVMEDAANSEGDLQALQTEGEAHGLWNMEVSRRNAVLGNYAALEAIHDRKQMSDDMKAMKAAQMGSEFRSVDWTHPTDQDLEYTRPSAPGFYDF